MRWLVIALAGLALVIQSLSWAISPYLAQNALVGTGGMMQLLLGIGLIVLLVGFVAAYQGRLARATIAAAAVMVLALRVAQVQVDGVNGNRPDPISGPGVLGNIIIFWLLLSIPAGLLLVCVAMKWAAAGWRTRGTRPSAGSPR